MVEVTDFEGNLIPNPNKTKRTDKEFLTYHIDGRLRRRWDKLRNGGLKKKDEDRCYIVDGRERTGKSVFALQQAKYIDPDFSIERVCFTPESFLKQIRVAPEGSCIIFDEAFRGLSSKGSQSKINKMIIQAMMEMGQRNLIVFIVLPTFFLLELYAAVLRSNALFHIYKDKKGRRVFKAYNYQRKSLLYNHGKKKGFSYSFPKVPFKSAGGGFFNIYSINEKEYRKKKLDSLQDMEIIKEDEESKTKMGLKVMTVNFFNYVKKTEKMSQRDFVFNFENTPAGVSDKSLRTWTAFCMENGYIREIGSRNL